MLRVELENLSRHRYGIWAGRNYATHQDVAGLFFVRSVDLYLKDGGVIGFVMPHSALQAGQFKKWRTGRWQDDNSGQTIQADFTVKSAWDLERLEPNTFFPVASCVTFAGKCPPDATGQPLPSTVLRWLGVAGSADPRHKTAPITDTSVAGISPYEKYSRQGASIVPRCLFFVEETANTAIIRVGQTITVNPRRGAHDKEPWKNLDLTAISNQTIENRHLFEVHLGETVAPYVTLAPLRALLPLKQGEYAIPTAADGVSGIRIGGLEQRMRQRWRTISQLWETNKRPVNKLNLLERVDYHRELSAQLAWQDEQGTRPVRVVYTSAGEPTAALLEDNGSIVESKLFWITCKDLEEANYLLAIINSDTLAQAVNRYTTPNWSGKTRDLQGHLWKLPIPEFDPRQKLHMVISKVGKRAAAGAAAKLAEVREKRGSKFTWRIARRELRAWLRASAEGKEVEAAVAALLGQGVDFRGTITIEEGKRFGKPCIRGIRMTAQDVMEYLAGGETWADMLYHFPNLTEQDMYVCLSFAAAEQMDDDYRHLRYAVV